MKLLKSLGIVAALVIPLIALFGWAVGQYNQEQDVRITFESEFRIRSAQFDKMFKIIKQKGIVAKQNDSSFQKMVIAMMQNRKDGENLGMKWVQEQYPNMADTKIAEIYQDLSRTIEAQRESFFEQERKLSDIKAEDDRLIRKFPGNLLHKMYGTQPIAYTPITSDRTEDAVKTGKDNDTDVF